MNAANYYRDLLAKVDAKFQEISGRNPDAFHCQKGCYSCCLPGLTVSHVEQENISGFLRDNPGRLEALKSLAHSNPHGGKHCALLTEGGACGIYEVRPVICRSHGAPIKVAGKEAVFKDVCPLNFTETTLDQLPDDDFINIDTLNTILAVINKAYDAAKAEKRFPLSWEALSKSEV